MIKLLRGELLESKQAIDSLGKVYVPMEKERYWFVRTLDKLKKALKTQNTLTQKYSNEKVHEFGKQTDGRIGIDPKDEEAMKQYQEAMNDFMEESVEVEVQPLTLKKLAELQVSLTANDQVALLWLITTED